jgi:hypothetical protein
VEMTRTFGLELAESLLSNYSSVFYKYQPFRCLLKGNRRLLLLLFEFFTSFRVPSCSFTSYKGGGGGLELEGKNKKMVVDENI